MTKEGVVWANPGAVGLACFGFTTLLLQLHNLGIIPTTMPVIWGFFWGGGLQILSGIIDARRGDTFGFSAFCSYGFFWVGLATALMLEWLGIITLDGASLAWSMIGWGLFPSYMLAGSLKVSRAHAVIFASLAILFFLLAAHFFGYIPAYVAGVEGIFCASSAIYVSAAVILNVMYGRWVMPIGLAVKQIPRRPVSPFPIRTK
jgi:succinate-acetate transporter protein